MGQARDLAKRLLGDRIIALLEHKSGHPKFAATGVAPTLYWSLMNPAP
jgi:hypothetical protein